MRTLACFAAAGMLAVVAFHANAATTAYGEAFDTLYKIDLDARTATTVGVSTTSSGGTPVKGLGGLTTMPDGSLYAVSNALKLLVKIDPTSGATSVVGNLNLEGQGTGQFDALDLGMAADGHGVVWLSSGTAQKLWRVDPSSGSLTFVGSTGHGISGLVARDDALYGSGDLTDHTFYRIDKGTGAATPIGSFGPAAPAALNSVSMSFDADGTLWAVLNYVPPAVGTTVPDWSDLATIDPASGLMTVLGPITGPESLRGIGMKGFTTGPARAAAAAASPAPIGSPWALGLLGLLLTFVGMRSVRRVGL
jgi:streptogramin lyase